MRLSGRSVLVTGATGGIGGAIAHDLARRGCAVIVTGRRQTHVTRLVTELGPPARCLVADLTKPDEIRNLLAAAEPVDVLVANAGIDMAATKWGLRGLGLALRQELHGTGVGVSTVFPGPIRDAGMFARTEVALPRGTGTNSPQDVARAVARAIERNRAETTVATGSMRLSAVLGGVAPVLVGNLARLLGAGRVHAAMVAARNRGDNGQPDG
jgi:short-subunit dehydrogenase